MIRSIKDVCPKPPSIRKDDLTFIGGSMSYWVDVGVDLLRTRLHDLLDDKVCDFTVEAFGEYRYPAFKKTGIAICALCDVELRFSNIDDANLYLMMLSELTD